MRKNSLEAWYDRLYELMLTAYMLLDSKEIHNKAASLKAEIKQEKQTT